MVVIEETRSCGCPGKRHSPHKEGCDAPRKKSGPSGGRPRFRLPEALGDAAAKCADEGLEAEATTALTLVLARKVTSKKIGASQGA